MLAKVKKVDIEEEVEDEGYRDSFVDSMAENTGKILEFNPFRNKENWFRYNGFVYHISWLEPEPLVKKYVVSFVVSQNEGFGILQKHRMFCAKSIPETDEVSETVRNYLLNIYPLREGWYGHNVLTMLADGEDWQEEYYIEKDGTSDCDKELKKLFGAEEIL